MDSKPEEYFKNVDLICVSECTIRQINRINFIARKLNKKFSDGDVKGTFGYTFADLMEHEYADVKFSDGDVKSIWEKKF